MTDHHQSYTTETGRGRVGIYLLVGLAVVALLAILIFAGSGGGDDGLPAGAEQIEQQGTIAPAPEPLVVD